MIQLQQLPSFHIFLTIKIPSIETIILENFQNKLFCYNAALHLAMHTIKKSYVLRKKVINAIN